MTGITSYTYGYLGSVCVCVLTRGVARHRYSVLVIAPVSITELLGGSADRTVPGPVVATRALTRAMKRSTGVLGFERLLPIQ